MTAKKTVITPVKHTWTLSKGAVHIWLYKHAEKGWGIATAGHEEGFVFMGYQTKNDLKIAKDVVKLLQDAIAFMEKNS